ncbi:hypothetical protein DF3PA_70131 [Candidatus Defluviicoccus seviourii]|uniref:Phage tail tape measure protein n=1 Tax=Candidatus Defluviicoccus seviourii TaxID=2565273 RepID=A0A564WH62_9PROT|nr:hypothetical protein DF3PA_70131 [Candidatus Defluviicoccus seviourii]
MSDKDFRVKFTADDAKLVAAINALTKGGAKISEAMNSADTDSKKAIKSITQEINKIQRSFNTLKPPAQIGPSFSKMAGAMGVGALGAMALSKAVGMVSTKFSEAFSKAGEWTDMADAIGMSVPKIQVLEATVTKAGVSFERVVASMFRLQKATQEAREGSTAQAEAFNKLNISAERLSERSIDEQFTTVVESLSTMEDATARNALAMELLGKSWAEISRIAPNLSQNLQETDRQLEAMGIKLTALDDKNLRELDDAFDMFNQTLLNGAMKAIAVVGPALIGFLKEAGTWIGALTKGWVEFQEAMERTNSIGERLSVLGGSYGNNPSTNGEFIQKRLMEAGYTDRQARGISESLYDESKLDPTAVNKESGATGIAQWLGPRLKALKEFADGLGKSYLNLDVQVRFMIKELETTEKATADKIRSIRGPDAGVYDDIKRIRNAWTESYERPGERAIAARENGPLKVPAVPATPDVSGQNQTKEERDRITKLEEEVKSRAKLLSAITLQAEQEELLLRIQREQGKVAADIERVRLQAIEAAKSKGFTEGSKEFDEFVSQSVRFASASRASKDLEEEAKIAEKREQIFASIAAEIAAQKELLAAALDGGSVAYEQAAERLAAATEAAKISRDTGIPVDQIQGLLGQKSNLESLTLRARNVADGRQSLLEENQNLESLATALAKSSDEYQKQLRLIQLTAQVRKEMVGATNEEIQAEVASRQELVEKNAELEKQNNLVATKASNNRPYADMANEYLAGTTDILTTAGQFQALQDAISGASDALTNFVFTGQGNLQTFALQFIQQITAMIVKALIFRAIMSAIGMGTGSPVAAADGGAFTTPTGAPIGGSVDLAAKGMSFFANGGVVNSPTPFKFASGSAMRTGIMGEAGPEAILPLGRDSHGRLGVRSSGQQTTNNFSVVINPHPQQSPADAERLGRQAADALKAEMVRTFTEQQKRGVRYGPGRTITA